MQLSVKLAIRLNSFILEAREKNCKFYFHTVYSTVLTQIEEENLNGLFHWAFQSPSLPMMEIVRGV